MKKPKFNAQIKKGGIGAGIRPAKPKKPKGGFGPAQITPAPVGAAPAPAAPTAPPVASPTGDYRYLEAQNQYNNRFADTNLALQNRQTQVEEQYGFNPTIAAANNPYTRANLLARRASQRFNTTTNAMAGRGQLYSGALNRARTSDEFTSGSELDTARKEYSQALQSIEQDRIGAQRDKQEGLSGAYGDYLDRLLSKETDPELFSEDEGGGGSGGGGKGKSKGGGNKKTIKGGKAKIPAKGKPAIKKAGIKPAGGKKKK